MAVIPARAKKKMSRLIEAVTVEDERRTYSTGPRERSRGWHFEAEEGTIWHDGDQHLRGQQTGEVALVLFFAR